MEMKRTSKLEDTTMQFNQHEQQREVRMKGEKKKKKQEQSLSVLWDNNNRSNISIIRIPEQKEQENET